MSRAGVTSYKPNDGKILWDLPVTGIRIIQPAIIADNDILIDAGDVKGVQRIGIKKVSDRWSVEEQWTSNRFKPNFNDLVIHKGHVFGFEGPCLVCMDIEKGDRIWRGGRYAGQLILLADQDLLLILSEDGELALVIASSEQFKELARFPAIEGKTWNHPALAGDILVVRNSQEMAAFRLPLKED
jgi:outer membrane protein assembly factor BamB